MPQTKSSSSRNTAKKQASTGRRTGAPKKKTSITQKSAGRSTASKTAAKSSAARSGTKARSSASSRAAQTRNVEPRRPIRREVGCAVLLVLGVVSFIAYFPVDRWLVNAVRSGLQGLIGWGFYIAPVCFLWGAVILGFHRGRPVVLRLTCVLLLPLAFGTFIHILLYDRDNVFTAGFRYGIHQLWILAQEPAEHCGGVVGGLLGIGLKESIGTVGSFAVLIVAVALMLLTGMNLSLHAIAAQFKSRPVRPYTPKEPAAVDEDNELISDDYFFPVDGADSLRKPKKTSFQAGQTQERKRQAAERAAGERAIEERIVTEEFARKSYPSFYDQSREKAKEELFADFHVDSSDVKSAGRANKTEKTVSKDAALHSEATSSAVAAVPDEAEGTQMPWERHEVLSQGERESVPAADTQNAQIGASVREPRAVKKKIDVAAEAAAVAKDVEDDAAAKPVYVFPPLDMLNSSGDEVYAAEGDDSETEVQLEQAVRSFGVSAAIVGAVHGPTITRYDLKLDQGVKLNKITNLAGDIALSLGVKSVRIAPVPDKISTVGVEVPNRHVHTVWLGDLVESDVFRRDKNKLCVALGKDIGGKVVVTNLAKMPHLLIAGTTGSGKSVCVNSMILSLLYKSTPEEVRMVMIDPKMVEFVVYNGMPHLYVPVVTDAKKATGALKWAVDEMLKRYHLFSESAVRDLSSYNARQKAVGGDILPQVVIFIDELADLMMVASKEVEEAICRVAQMGRAAGMHLVIATQSPRADVITGLMKANIPSRIALSVSGPLESRIILDQQGAEKLLGNGDMLYSPIGSKPIRLQGAFVTDEERERIIEFVKKDAEAQYSDEILAEMEKAAEGKNAKDAAREEDPPKSDYDELLPQAADVIFETKQASTSMLQRRMKLGYARASRIIDQLEQVGLLGPYEGSKPRKVLLTKQQWQEMQYSHGTAPVDTTTREFAEISESATFAPDPPSDVTAGGSDGVGVP